MYGNENIVEYVQSFKEKHKNSIP